jgi:2-dehydro-3-deoxygluconokinase
MPTISPSAGSTPPKYEVTAVGSTMLRLTAKRGTTLDRTNDFEVDIAGSESNVLIALSRLGYRTCWATKIADNPLGRRIVRNVRSEGVDVSNVKWADGDNRVELVFLEPGVRPRPTLVHYDRRGAAIDTLNTADLDIDAILDTRMYHYTGILASLSTACRTVAAELKLEAQRRGLALSFDLNFRQKLWPVEDAATCLSDLSRGVTILFLSPLEAGILGLSGTAHQISVAAHSKFSASVVVVKNGPVGAVAYDGERVHEQRGLDTEVVDRLGAGDAFCAGVIHGYLRGSVELGLRYGCRMAALKLTTIGDRFVFGLEDLGDDRYRLGMDVDR